MLYFYWNLIFPFYWSLKKSKARGLVNYVLTQEYKTGYPHENS